MAIDPRQVLAAVLTITMFVMLGNMIKRDHFDSLQVDNSDTAAVQKASEFSHASLSEGGDGPWKEESSSLKPCWDKPVLEEAEQSKGYVTFSLTNGPEYHVSQIADAVAVARYLRATLVLPDIRGSEFGDRINWTSHYDHMFPYCGNGYYKIQLETLTSPQEHKFTLRSSVVNLYSSSFRNFEDVYDVDKFIKSLQGVVKVAKTQPTEISAHNLAVVRVQNRVTEEYLAENVEPVFRSKGNIRLATYFSSVNMKKTEGKSNLDSVSCLAMFGSLELQPEVQEVVDSMVERLKTLSRKSDGQFVAVDLRVDMLEKKGCKEHSVSKSKSCYNPQEIALFLKNIGFQRDTTIYVTQSKWDNSLDHLKDFFPKTYTKENIMPADKRAKFLESGASEFEKVIDFYICSQSDVFVPAISGLFYANVAGERIATGKTQILVPAVITDPTASPGDFISHYVTQKNHFAYSCFC